MGDDPATPRVRLPAAELETRVADRLRAFMGSPQSLSEALIEIGDAVPVRRHLLKRAKELIAPTSDSRTLLTSLRPAVQSVLIMPESIDVRLDRIALKSLLLGDEANRVSREDGLSDPVVLTVPSRLFRSGHHLRMVVTDDVGANESGTRDNALIRLIARGRRWYEQLTSGEMPSLRAIAKAEGVRENYAARIFAGALLAPDIIECVLGGRQPVTFTVESLRRPPPLDWTEQRLTFGFPRVQPLA